MSDSWAETTSIGTLRSDDLAKPGIVFRYNRYLYRTTSQHLANGGMGTVYTLDRRDDETGVEEAVVGKVFHSNYLYQLRTDEVTRGGNCLVGTDVVRVSGSAGVGNQGSSCPTGGSVSVKGNRP